MSEVVVGGSESLDSALKRFLRKVYQDGVISEVRRREYYESPA